MSKFSKFLDGVKTFGPLVLMATPLAPIAPKVVEAIQAAEALKDAKGEEKLAHVLDVVKASTQAAQMAGVPIDPDAVEHAMVQTVQAVVAIANVAHAKAS